MLTTVQAAKVLNVHPNTLVNWRWMGAGPKYTKRKNRVYYRDRDVIRYRSKLQPRRSSVAGSLKS